MGYERIGAALVTVMIATGALAQDHHNAATHYQRAMERLEAMSWEEINLVWEYDGAAVIPSPELRSVLSKAQPILNDFRRGSLQSYSNFDLDFSRGFALPVDHLTDFRQIAYLSRADIGVRLHDGDSIGAADRIAAMSRNIAHYKEDRMFTSSLVGMAMYSFTDRLIEEGLQHGALDSAALMSVLQPLEQLTESGDPFGFAESLAHERQFTTSLLREGADENIIGDLNEMLSLHLADSELIDQEVVTSMSDDAFAQHVSAYDAAMGDIIDVFAMDDHEAAAAAMAEIESSFLESEHNLLAPLITIVGKSLTTRNLIEPMMSSRIDSLRALLGEDADADNLVNAAVWYLRGIDLINELFDEQSLEALRSVRMITDSPMDEDMQRLLSERGQRVIQEFREGSEIRRCDFSIARTRSEFPAIQPYAPGMRDAFRLLHADAIRLLQHDELDAAAERLAICYRIIGHLSSDGQLVTSLLSHIVYEHTHLLVDAAIISQQLGHEHILALAAAHEHIAMSDPFGYQRAVQGTRHHGAKLMESYSEYWPDHVEAFTRVGDVIRASDGDRLIALMVLHESHDRHRWQRMKDDSPPAPDYYLSPIDPAALGDVLLLEDLATLRAESLQWSTTLLDEGFDENYHPTLTRITDIESRMERARDLLSIGAAMFEAELRASADD